MKTIIPDEDDENVLDNDMRIFMEHYYQNQLEVYRAQLRGYLENVKPNPNQSNMNEELELLGNPLVEEIINDYMAYRAIHTFSYAPFSEFKENIPTGLFLESIRLSLINNPVKQTLLDNDKVEKLAESFKDYTAKNINAGLNFKQYYDLFKNTFKSL